MILSGDQIKLEHEYGSIMIKPWNPKQINPNSYNLRLANELVVYDAKVLDCAMDNPWHKITIPEEGLVIKPGVLYLGKTIEYTRTDSFVPMLEGRSSVGRLGIMIHATAGFGDVGFRGCWTLEISCVQPVKIYPGMEICQIYYHEIESAGVGYDGGKYQGSRDIQTSKLWKEFEHGEK